MVIKLTRYQKDYLRILVLLVLPALGFFYQEDIKDLFRLTGESTAYEFNKASIKDAVDWLERQCNDGVCLDSVDWKCGFEIDWYDTTDGDFNKCVIDVALRVKPWTSLNTISKYCGKKNAVFVGASAANPENRKKMCASIGGQWGVLSPAPAIYFN